MVGVCKKKGEINYWLGFEFSWSYMILTSEIWFDLTQKSMHKAEMPLGFQIRVGKQ